MSQEEDPMNPKPETRFGLEESRQSVLVRPEGELNPEWIEVFYRECGREATLAYTTLNQMKNWAMTVAAAGLSGIAFGSHSGEFPNQFTFVGVVVMYVFVLRFFFRAILCYTNLLRWNKLQSDCVELKLRPSPKNHGPKDNAALENQLRDDIDYYYFRWLSTIDRKNQLASNLKLGFGLIFALVLFFLLWGLINLWDDRLVRALLIFSLGTTLVEFNDFFKSSFFDDVRAFAKRKSRSRAKELFPVPATRGWYVTSWVIVIALSVTYAEWPTVISWLKSLIYPA